MEETLDSLFHRAQLAAAMRDPIELAELRESLEALLEEKTADQVAEIRARFAPLFDPAPPPAIDTAESLYARGTSEFAADRPEAALDLWERAAELAPENFELRRRLGLVQRALERHDAADASLVRLCELYAAADAPPLSELVDVMVDRFHLGGKLVTVHRRLAPYSDRIDYVWVFILMETRTQRQATVQIETSEYGRERGTPYILGMNRPGGHVSLDHSWQALPPYLELRTLASGYLGRVLSEG